MLTLAVVKASPEAPELQQMAPDPSDEEAREVSKPYQPESSMPEL